MKGLQKPARIATALCIVALVAGMVTGCRVLGSGYHEGRYIDNKYMDSRSPSRLNTAGIESSDLQTACKSMVGKLLADARFAGTYPPSMVVEPKYFMNQADHLFNEAVLVDLVRNELINASEGKVRVFHWEGEGDPAVDYALGARITQVRQTGGARTESYIQIDFEVIDLRTKQIIFSDLYDFKKASTFAGVTL